MCKGRIIKTTFIGILIFIISIFSFLEVSAHPHVWIDPEIKFVFSQEGLEQIRLRYVFDEMYSAMRLNQFDKNNSGELDNKEKEFLGIEILQEIKEDNYFIHLKHGNSVISADPPEIFNISFGEDERLILDLKISYSVPITTDYQIVSVSVFDRNYYYEVMTPGEKAVDIEGKVYVDHMISFIEDAQNAYYFEQFYPVYTVIKFKKQS